LKILVVNYARELIGGIEAYLHTAVPALAARGHHIGFLYERAAAAATADLGCQQEWLAGPDPASRRTAVAAAQCWRPDAIWFHGVHSSELEAALFPLAPVTAFVHSYDGTCATGEKSFRWPSPRPCSRRMGPMCWANNFTRQCGLRRPDHFASHYQRQRQRAAALARCRNLAVASRHLAADLQRQLGPRTPPLQVLPFPLMQPRVRSLPERPAPPRRLLMLSRLTRAKGGEVLLRAAALAQPRLPQRLQLTIAGDGPELPRLRRLAWRMNLDVHFPGWVLPIHRAALLAAADLLVVPSLWPEPFGLVGMEAQAQAVPAVAFDLGGIPEWLHPGVTGELAPAHPPRPEALADALARALADLPHWQALCRQAWEHAATCRLDPHLDRIEAMLACAEAAGA